MMKTPLSIAALAIALLSTHAWSQDFSKPPGKPGTRAYNQWVTAALTRLQRLSDEDSLRELAYHYGRGNDAISIHHADHPKGLALGSAEYAQAFAPDAQVEVYTPGGTKPISSTTGVPAWAEFVGKFYTGYGYSSTVHLMSNFDIEFISADTAKVSAYAIAPHFILDAAAKDKASADTTAEWMHCRYSYDAKRQPDGGWKMTRLSIYLEEIWRAGGFFPSGQGKGL